MIAPAAAIASILLAQTPAPAVPPAPSAPKPPSSAPPTPTTPPTPAAPADPIRPNAVQPAAIPEGDGLREVFPGVRLDAKAKLVEFDATISPMLVKDEKAPDFFLEVLACSFNTREHETFVVTRVKPSHIHAAMLAIGLTPGTPGTWTRKDGKLTPVDPTGDRVRVRFAYTLKDGTSHEADPLDWIVSSRDKRPFAAALSRPGEPVGFVFAGSKLVTRNEKTVYDADGAGAVVGLTTFGSEVVALSRVISPDAAVEQPQWVADFSKTPPADTKVRVRLSPERPAPPPASAPPAQ